MQHVQKELYKHWKLDKQAHIHLVTGGQRSGKSAFAEELVLNLSEAPIYLATSKAWDKEHQKRIDTHIERRTSVWTTIEEPIDLQKHDYTKKVILLDCITLWLTNIYDKHQYEQTPSLAEAKSIFEELLTQDAHFVIVTNEIGMGVIPMEKSTRKFVDIHGELNQYIAQRANEVTLMVSGLPLKVKG